LISVEIRFYRSLGFLLCYYRNLRDEEGFAS
jgi:hypothetical protein